MRIRVFNAGLLPPAARRPKTIAGVCRRALRTEGFQSEGELNVVIMDRKGMLELNKRYLEHAHDTDVIAFPYADDPKPGEPFGDVYISAYQARLQAAEQGHSVLREVLVLAVHGTLHLLGYDDATPRQKAAMFKKQDELLDGKEKSRSR